MTLKGNGEALKFDKYALKGNTDILNGNGKPSISTKKLKCYKDALGSH